jgi:hypothetical protein
MCCTLSCRILRRILCLCMYMHASLAPPRRLVMIRDEHTHMQLEAAVSVVVANAL